MRNRLRNCAPAGALLLLLATASAVGQSQPALDGLIAEVRMERSLYRPADPIRGLFLLRNPTSEPIRVPIPETDPVDGVVLPLELIFGNAADPALRVTYEAQPTDILRPVETARPDRNATLTIAPHGAVGVEIDLRQHSKYLRYSGLYRLEWRPPIEGVARVEVEFRVEARKQAIFVTDFGRITIDLSYETAPKNVDNFLDLVRSRFYDGKKIHRIQPGFVIQGGSSDGTGAGLRPDGKTVVSELGDVPFTAGTLAMSLAHDPETKEVVPDSASCQFFICLSRVPDLDGKYSVIGQASDEESMRTLQRIAAQPVDKDWSPKQTVWIGSVTLLDVEGPAPRRFDGAAAKP